MSKWKMLGIGIALFAVAVSLINASWLAPTPKGRLLLVAHRGLAQQFDREGVDDDTCTAARIKPVDHNFIENTLFSMQNAVSFGADAIELDVQPTSDGHMIVFSDPTLDCRTEGKGPVRARTLAELKALDVGYGYTADGGKTFPLRGRGVGAMPTVEQVLQAFPTMPLVFNFKSKDPKDADALLAAFARAGVKPDEKYSYYGDPGVTGRLKQLVPDAWVFSKENIGACMTDYTKIGWTGYVPESCRGTTVLIPLNHQWAIWGWPNRFLDRMAGAGSRVIMFGDYQGSDLIGIERPEDLDRVPRSFRGYLWIEDFYTVGRALQR